MTSGTKSLLGLGRKYCIQVSRPTNQFKKTLDQFQENARRIAFFKANPPDEESPYNYITGLYIKSG